VVNYWIFKVTDDENEQYRQKGISIYTHRMKESFWGIKGTKENGSKASNVDYLKKGDIVIFYLVGKGGQCFLGTAHLASGFRALTAAESAKITHKEFLDWEQGVLLEKESISVWPKPLPIEKLRGKVHFVPVGKNYGSYLQGAITRIQQWEYDAIINIHGPE
jgi:hypothetical protein